MGKTRASPFEKARSRRGPTVGLRGANISYNPEHHGRMKHVARCHFFIRECVENHQIRVPFVRTDDNQADFFTKVLPGRKFFPLRNLIMNVEDRNLDVPRSRGGVEM